MRAGSMTVAAVALSVAVAACEGGFTGQPVMAEGTLVDDAGVPVPGIVVTLDVLDATDAEQGDFVRLVFHAEDTTDADGRFAFHAQPPPELRQQAAATGGRVSMRLTAVHPVTSRLWTWDLVREIGVAGWADEAVPLRLTPAPGRGGG